MSRQLDHTVEGAQASFEAGDLTGAEAACLLVLRKAPRHARALHLLGTIRLESGDAADASILLGKAARLSPADASMQEALALAQLGAGEFGAAERTLLRALKLAGRPKASLHSALAWALSGLGRFEEAESATRAALLIEPGNPRLLMDLGQLLARRDRCAEARACFEEAFAADPGKPEAQFNAAVMLEREGRHEDASLAYAVLLARHPRYHDAHVNLGIAYEHLGRTDDAIRCYERALEIEPGSVHAYANLGKALRAAGRLDEAEAACMHALQIAPQFVDAIVNLAGLLTERGNAEGALLQYEKALALDPQAADVQFSHAALDLALGRYAGGWRSYAWRPTRLKARAAGIAVDGALPRDVEGTSVLVLGEQGLGDELFFLRYAAVLASLGARVHVECDPRLATIVARAGAFESVTAAGMRRPDADHTYIAGDLPLMLGDAGGFRTPPPLDLTAVEERSARLRASLQAIGEPPYIGLTWRAGTPPELQRGRPDRALFKAIPLDALARAVRATPGTLIVLQREPFPGEIERLSLAAGRTVHDFSAANADLEDMLALLSLLEEYVGVSNTNMHLRAGLQRAARVLVPNPPEWRWMWSGLETPWFPGFGVYRETPAGGWDAALTRLALDLAPAHARNKDFVPSVGPMTAYRE